MRGDACFVQPKSKHAIRNAIRDVPPVAQNDRRTAYFSCARRERAAEEKRSCESYDETVGAMVTIVILK